MRVCIIIAINSDDCVTSGIDFWLNSTHSNAVNMFIHSIHEELLAPGETTQLIRENISENQFIYFLCHVDPFECGSETTIPSGSVADPWHFGVAPDPRIHAFD
jgi:hypothetical protein